MRTNLGLATLCLALALPAAAQFTPMATAAPDSVPSGMNYQGRLEKDGFPVTGNKPMSFRLYNLATGGTALYDSGTLSVAVGQGIFAVSLDIPFGALTGTAQKYLELEVDGVVLAPRDPLRSVPYAKVAETVEGTINISTAGITFQTNVGDSLAISSASGRVGIGTASPAARLHVSSGAGESGVIVLVSTGASTLVTIDGNGVLTTNHFVGDGTNLRNVVRRSGDSMSGSLTLNASTLTVVGSGFSVAGTEFTVGAGRTGVGTASPLAVLTVVGDSSFSQPATFLSSVTVRNAAQFGSGATVSTFSAAGALALNSNASLAVGTTFFVNNGSVLIAAAAGSTYALRLNGDLLVGNVDAHDLTAGSDVHVEGNVILDGRLIQHGTTGTSLDNLAVIGAATFKSSATFVGAAGAVGIGGTLGVGGTTTLGSSATVNSAFLATGASALKSTLGVDGTTTMGSSLTVREKAEFGLTGVSSFSAAGALTMAAAQNIRVTAGGELLGLPGTPTVNDAAASKAFVVSQTLAGSGWSASAGIVRLNVISDNVGIGTISPGARLQVAGTQKIDGAATFAGTVTFRDTAGFGTASQSSFNNAGVLSLGTALAVADGGTGAINAANARTNLGLVIGTDVQAFDADLTDLADGSLTGSKVGSGVAAANVAAGNLVAGVTITAGGVDLSTVTTALAGKQDLDADLTDLADGTLTGSKVGSGVPAANIAAGNLAAGVTITAGGVDLSTITTALAGKQDLDADLTDLADGTLTGSKVGSGVAVANISAGTFGAGLFTFSGAVGLNSQNISGLLGITPTAVGQMYYCNNCNPLKVVVSTGTAIGNFAAIDGGPFQ